jgi:transcriptional regulator with XRE-family HTH domain
MDAVQPSSEAGRKLRRLRYSRGKSLAVVAGLAGISTSYLSLLERGERALDRRSLIVKLANALQVAPSEITGAELATTPGKPLDDQAAEAIRHVLMDLSLDEPGGEVQPVEQLRDRVKATLTAENNADTATVGTALPALIRDLHATADAHQDEREVLRLLALAHTQGTQAWLTMIGAPLDLSWQAATLARRAAERLDEPVSLAVSAYGTALGLLGAGRFDAAARKLTAVDLPTLATAGDLQLGGSLALASSLVAAASGRHAEQAAALDHAAELAKRTGEGNALWLGFGPSNVGVWRMSVALETGDHGQAAEIATTINPDALPSPRRRSTYWREYGRALARLPRRQDEAVMALRRAELISPARVHRHAFTRSVIAELLTRRSKRDAVGQELRGIAYRAGLPV